MRELPEMPGLPKIAGIEISPATCQSSILAMLAILAIVKPTGNGAEARL
jgi:hypothetical protein